MVDRSTIFARSSGGGRAGVAVYRVSGPLAGPVLDRCCGGRGTPRLARLVAVRDLEGALLDRGLSLWFPGPASFTGEDVAELHLHGSPAVDRAFGEAMTAFGLEPATAGAFTMRAFAAGKLDLTQAEGLADLLDAETEGQRRQALGQLGGRLSGLTEGWRARLLSASALVEASVDFADEEDAPTEVGEDVRTILASLAAEMRREVEGAGRARTVREGVTVAITGPPNAGKSTLLNVLAGEERAIVSPRAGTTRDVLRVTIELAGQKVTLLDTAGIREAADEVEREGVRRAEKAAREADLTVQMVDAREAADTLRTGTVAVANKTDLVPTSSEAGPPEGWLPLSLRTGEGLDDLLDRITALVVSGGGGGTLTRDRHVTLVRAACGTLERASLLASEPEVVSEELRLVLRSLGELTGAIGTEEVLGEVFSSFCIGK